MDENKHYGPRQNTLLERITSETSFKRALAKRQAEIAEDGEYSHIWKEVMRKGGGLTLLVSQLIGNELERRDLIRLSEVNPAWRTYQSR